ncbi:MAG: nucleotidyltransferase domain-containing protein [Planctomycetota bacterium]
MSKAVVLTVDEIRRRITETLERNGVRKCILFGSHARNDVSRHSDVDLLLVKSTSTRFLDRTRDLQYELSSRLPESDVDVLCYTPEELQRMQSRKFIQTILSEGKVIYERQ